MIKTLVKLKQQILVHYITSDGSNIYKFFNKSFSICSV